MANLGFGGKNIIDIVKYKSIFLTLSALVIIPCICIMVYTMVTTGSFSPVRLGIDFTGGTFLQYGFEQKLETGDINELRKVLSTVGLEGAIIQLQKPTNVLGAIGTKTELEPPKEAAIPSNMDNISENKEKQPTSEAVEATSKADVTAESTKTPESRQEAKQEMAEESVSTEESQLLADENVNTVVSFRVKFLDEGALKNLNQVLRDKYGSFSVIQTTAIGPSLGKELLTNSMLALILVFGAIVAYLSFRFQFDYAVCALIALFHDAIFVLGIFSLLGILYNTEVDSMFVTAMLTVIGFSVHDTIVVFDRIRENSRFLSKKKSFSEIVNDSVNQTLARSINTSLTTLITLGCLYFFGGVTTRDFVLAMMLGIAVGTYSSIFNASVILAWWRSKQDNASYRKKTA